LAGHGPFGALKRLLVNVASDGPSSTRAQERVQPVNSGAASVPSRGSSRMVQSKSSRWPVDIVMEGAGSSIIEGGTLMAANGFRAPDTSFH